MNARCWLLQASPGRTAIEAALATLALGLPLLTILADLPNPVGRSSSLVLAAAYAGLFGRLVGALRLRGTVEGWRRRLTYEVGAALLLHLVVTVATLLAGLPGALLAPEDLLVAPRLRDATNAVMPGLSGMDRLLSLIETLAMIGVGAQLTAPAYLLFRGAALLWPRWDQRRRSRLLWALTHAQLIAGLVLALAVAAVIGIATFFAIDVTDLTSAGVGNTSLLARVVIFVLPAATALLLLGVGLIVAILPPIALISFAVLRRPTRRLEELAAAAERMRAGDLSARVPVAGEDEVARLQSSFNAMAADLERLVRELQTERDTVARLLQARRELVASVSHELRTPVATLRGYLDSAMAHWDDSSHDPPAAQPDERPGLRDDLRVMSRETERLQRLIDDLFILARAEVDRLPLALQPTDVDALLRRCAAAAAPVAWQRGRVEVTVETPPDLPPALADPDRLEQVVRNLLTNAVRHTPPGGFVVLSAATEAGMVAVRVEDTGEGIAPQDLPHVFERFYRAAAARDRDRGGAGLGLALVKELTEAMGGSVAVASALGEGSCFTLRLPTA